MAITTQAFIQAPFITKNRSNLYGSASIIVKTERGYVGSVSVLVAGSTPGAIYDSSSIVDPSLLICSIPNTVGIYPINFPVEVGIVVVPGTDQVFAISYA
jgi:hypothetical protein